ncbi:conserved hypothetical protein [Verticillium alfalfae VaMs.102]|uniref:Zinc finger PHD-type domain-containing protein n=1 Tax=Verticillium alfalfae (strain VaMs.102 / ATCC MYA-4576 / FGSC 10136) TaxID=526221 RepID=C9SVH7_VERA1|nr:conserved hypothetical protein [Verticillium alfalfae VaMs.102]EEY22792.1 conserved hypothetical protein [Verticillium alfalfae VaMs.102]
MDQHRLAHHPLDSSPANPPCFSLGPEIDLYSVEDKKQTHEFDLRQWLQENPEEEEPEEETPCPICGMAERPDILLLCDGCDAAYHTHCHVRLGRAGDRPSTNHRRPFVRTRERQRRARRQARSVEWQGAWGQIAGRIFEATDIDLDNYEDDDSLEGFRRTQQQRERESREYREWEQRLQIASRQGAGETFARSIPRAIGERLDIVQPVQETAENTKAKVPVCIDVSREAAAAAETGAKVQTPSHSQIADSGSALCGAVYPKRITRQIAKQATRATLKVAPASTDTPILTFASLGPATWPAASSPTRPRSQVVSPASDLSREEKERVSAFVKSALKPHWDIEDRKITAEQYSNINRDVSRKLYDGLRDPAMAEDKAQWEARAKEEVTRAVAALQQAIPA